MTIINLLYSSYSISSTNIPNILNMTNEG